MPNFCKSVLDVYSDCLSHIWAWTKTFLVGLAVLLPGLIFLIYMFVANMPDVGILAGLIVICLIALWAPIPLKPFFYKDKTFLGMYIGYLTCVAAAICIVIAIFIYVWWILLPILIEVAICTVADRDPTPAEGILFLVGNLIWGPIAHCIFVMLMEKIFKTETKES